MSINLKKPTDGRFVLTESLGPAPKARVNEEDVFLDFCLTNLLILRYNCLTCHF